jgi:iron complex transport system substrate-binding protein
MTRTRVVSLLPGATELLYALGVEPVGVTHECDHPPAARDVPTMNRSKVASEGTSAEVNAAVADAAEAGGVYELREGRLREANPDVVVTQAACDVCAVPGALVEETVADLGLGADVVDFHPHTLPELFAAVERVGAAVGREGRGAALASELRERVECVRDRADGPDDGPRVVVLDWMDPPMVAGHWVPELVEAAGGRYGLADPADRSTPREWAAVREYDPDVLVAAPCGFELDRTLAHADELRARPGWGELAAVPDSAYAMDGHGHVNRPGPRLVETVEGFAALLDNNPSESPAPVASVCR